MAARQNRSGRHRTTSGHGAAAAADLSAFPGSERQLASPSYRLPATDVEFLITRDELRAVRFALEYEKAELLLRDAGIRSTVVVFGSARILPRERAETLLRNAHGTEERQRARRRLHQSIYYETAREFGRIVSERGGALD
ncbi:MAG TPA: 3-isopropylmalate dehydrogenase, partial [Dongiaceae bacterium]|nr:3-isopropylmalate dehydrogenase [Dongiaceae bacterium]